MLLPYLYWSFEKISIKKIVFNEPKKTKQLITNKKIPFLISSVNLLLILRKTKVIPRYNGKAFDLKRTGLFQMVQ